MTDEARTSINRLTPYGRSKAGDIETKTNAEYPNRIFFTLPNGDSTPWAYLSQNTNGVYRFSNQNPEKGQLNIGEGDHNTAIAYVQPGRFLDIIVNGHVKISKGSKDGVTGWYEYLGPASQIT